MPESLHHARAANPRKHGEKSPETRKQGKQGVWVAEEPVWSYPVSTKFPANRENNSEFLLFSGNQCRVRRKNPRLFNALLEISLLTGTGNFFDLNTVISSSSRELDLGGTILPMQTFGVI